MQNDNNVERHRFFKNKQGNWYIDLPEWEGALAELEMVAGADALLDQLSAGKDEVYLDITTEPKPGFELLELVEEKAFGGADYVLKTLGNSRLDHPLWLCHVTRFVFDEYPLNIWFRVVSTVK